MKRKRAKKIQIKFRLTKNRKGDVIRYAIAGLFFFSLLTMYWNHSETPLKNLERGYHGFILAGQYKQHMLDEKGVTLIKSWLEEKTSPSLNPITILVEHQKSKNPEKNYELVIGMTAMTEDGFREYAIYQTQKTIYLRVEPMGIDRVLRASFSANDLQKALKPYIGGEFRSTTFAHRQPESAGF